MSCRILPQPVEANTATSAPDTRPSGSTSNHASGATGSPEARENSGTRPDHIATGTAVASYPFTPQAAAVQDAVSKAPQSWPLKTISWPPFSQNPRQVKILIQDVNGPCSFLALCNILLVSKSQGR